MFEERILSLNPVAFFGISFDCWYLPKGELPSSSRKHLLPSTHALTSEEIFGELSIGWCEEGIVVDVHIKQPAVQSFYPNVEQGDSLELFLDTRDLKTAGFNTRFCHHFFFLPQAVEGFTHGEITHFRTEDSHPLCHPDVLLCQTTVKKKEYQMKIFIPSECLYGYDFKQFDRLGFTYRMNRFKGKPQHFTVVSEDYQIDQQPSLWGSLKLIHENNSL